MKEKKHEGTFIPCGDSMERMEEIRDDKLENIPGETGETTSPKIESC